jgi:hypothetical protein
VSWLECLACIAHNNGTNTSQHGIYIGNSDNCLIQGESFMRTLADRAEGNHNRLRGIRREFLHCGGANANVSTAWTRQRQGWG